MSYFISVGETHAFYTLRQTGVFYAGRDAIPTSFHIQNLSTDLEEAFKKAQDMATAAGEKLVTHFDWLKSQNMRDITRQSPEELEYARNLTAAKVAEKEAAKAAHEASLREKIAQGIMPFGAHAGVAMRDLPVSYINWMATATNLEGLMAECREKILELCSDLLLPVPSATGHVGKIKERATFRDAIVIRKGGFYRRCFSGYGEEYVNVITFCLRGGQCAVSFSTSFGGKIHVGDTLTFKATIKSHDNYNGQDQTVIQRITIA